MPRTENHGDDVMHAPSLRDLSRPGVGRHEFTVASVCKDAGKLNVEPWVDSSQKSSDLSVRVSSSSPVAAVGVQLCLGHSMQWPDAAHRADTMRQRTSCSAADATSLVVPFTPLPRAGLEEERLETGRSTSRCLAEATLRYSQCATAHPRDQKRRCVPLRHTFERPGPSSPSKLFLDRP